MIRIKIHRGSHQIGGCATEIECDGERILIDLGANLPGTDDTAKITDKMLLESVFGGNGEYKYDGILFSHYHGDHYGLFEKVPKDIPMYIGETAKEILGIVSEYIDPKGDRKRLVESMRVYTPGKPLKEFNKLKITPFVVDHSALDSYMFLIEAEGKRILFTGDFRDHGIANNRNQLWRIIEKRIGKIDLLITEGTMLSRVEEAKTNIDKNENELGAHAARVFKNKLYNFVCVSSTNLDSIMEFYHNTPEDKIFVCDAYQARLIITAIEKKCRWYEEYQGKRVDADSSFTKMIYLTGKVKPEIYDEINSKAAAVKKRGYATIFFKKIWDEAEFEQMLKRGFVYLVRPEHYEDKYPKKFLSVVNQYRSEFPDEVNMIYSMWKGYLVGDKKDNDILKLVGDIDKIEWIHTSGHAYVETIARLMKETEPEYVIPIHSEMTDSFNEFEEFEKYKDAVRVLQDGRNFML